MPTVSVILPTYNGARCIQSAIESVCSQIYTDWELFVVDDGSTDATPALVAEIAERDSRIQYVKNDINLGIQKTLNKGLSLATGKYVARIDDDDAWTDSNKLAAQVEYLEAHPECVLIGTGARIVDEEGREINRYFLPETDVAIRRSMLAKNCFAHASVVFRTENARAVGGYGESPDVRHVEDYDLWLRLGLSGLLANLPSISVTLTARPGSLSAKNRQEQFVKMLALAKKYRDSYPGYSFAAFGGRLRLAFFSFFKLLPRPLRIGFLRFYKRHW